MSKRGRKRRGRKKNAANHGKRPNAWALRPTGRRHRPAAGGRRETRRPRPRGRGLV